MKCQCRMTDLSFRERSKDHRNLLRMTFDGPWAYCKETGHRTAQFALPFKVLERLNSAEKRMVEDKGALSNQFNDIIEELDRWVELLEHHKNELPGFEP